MPPSPQGDERTSRPPLLEIVVPAYNEELDSRGAPAAVREACRNAVPDRGHRRRQRQHRRHRGHRPDLAAGPGAGTAGRAARLPARAPRSAPGLLETSAPFVGFCDADMATDLAALDVAFGLLLSGRARGRRRLAAPRRLGRRGTGTAGPRARRRRRSRARPRARPRRHRHPVRVQVLRRAAGPRTAADLRTTASPSTSNCSPTAPRAARRCWRSRSTGGTCPARRSPRPGTASASCWSWAGRLPRRRGRAPVSLRGGSRRSTPSDLRERRRRQLARPVAPAAGGAETLRLGDGPPVRRAAATRCASSRRGRPGQRGRRPSRGYGGPHGRAVHRLPPGPGLAAVPPAACSTRCSTARTASRSSRRWVLPRRTRVLCVVHHVHDRQFGVHLPRWLAAVGRFLEGPASRWTYRRRDSVAVSPSTVTRHAGAAAAGRPIHIVPNGVNVATAAYPRKAVTPRLVCVGRLVAHKRVDLLLDAVAGCGSGGPDLTGDVVGRARRRRRLRAPAPGGRHHARLPARGRRRTRLVAAAWLHLNTSQGEGWGLCVLEAAALGVPTVAFDVDGLRDAVRARRDGLAGARGRREHRPGQGHRRGPRRTQRH